MPSLTACSLTTGESAHFAETCGAAVNKNAVSRIIDEIVEEMTERANRPPPNHSRTNHSGDWTDPDTPSQPHVSRQ